MKQVDPIALIAVVAFAASFLFPGIRVEGVPVSPASIISLIFIPGIFSAYEPRRLRLVIWCLIGLIVIFGRNALVYGFEFRDALYLLLPLSAIGATVVVKKIVDAYGLARVQYWAVILCVMNLVLMIAQAVNLGDIVTHLEALWTANIAFVVNDVNQAQILWNTFAIRPPGLFPTGIYASTVIYIVCRSLFLTQRKTWPMLVAMLAILLTANRTIAVVFFLYESIALIYTAGVFKFIVRGLILLMVCILLLTIIAASGSDLYLLTFLTDEIGGGSISDTGSVTERLKTFDLFMAYAPEYLALGGFSSSAIVNEQHVFDSELILRSLQFGVFGIICMVFIVLVPRVGRRNSAWNFLFFLAFLASLTTTFMTSIVYLMVIALYKESVMRTKIMSM